MPASGLDDRRCGAGWGGVRSSQPPLPRAPCRGISRSSLKRMLFGKPQCVIKISWLPLSGGPLAMTSSRVHARPRCVSCWRATPWTLRESAITCGRRTGWLGPDTHGLGCRQLEFTSRQSCVNTAIKCRMTLFAFSTPYFRALLAAMSAALQIACGPRCAPRWAPWWVRPGGS